MKSKLTLLSLHSPSKETKSMGNGGKLPVEVANVKFSFDQLVFTDEVNDPDWVEAEGVEFIFLPV